MFPDYQSLVMQHYEKKLNDNQLSSRLSHPTTAQLKAECVAKSANGFLPKDRKTLVDFFGENGDNKAILEEMANCYVDIFKPLLNYLNKKTNKTNPKNIELLAWLTDFEPRQYERGKRYILDEVETGDTDLEEFQEGEQDEAIENLVKEKKKPEPKIVETPPQGPTIIVVGQKDGAIQKSLSSANSLIDTKRRPNPKIIVAALFTIIATAASIIYVKSEKTGCMYWAGDHYEQIPCSQKVGPDTLVIALDNERLNSFKKITRPDTITRSSIGKIWYKKINKDSIEYYTAGGNYPLDNTLKLKPLTEYMFDHHIGATLQDTSH